MADAADELRFLAAQLRLAGNRDVLKELRRGLKDAAGAAAETARQTVLAMPSKNRGRHETGLRRGIADTVKVETSLGVSTARVRIVASGPERFPGAAWSLEGNAWRHPVFGLPEDEALAVHLQSVHGRGFGHGRGWIWVTQRSPLPRWFDIAVGSHQDDFDRAVDEVVERIERRLAGEA